MIKKQIFNLNGQYNVESLINMISVYCHERQDLEQRLKTAEEKLAKAESNIEAALLWELEDHVSDVLRQTLGDIK